MFEFVLAVNNLTVAITVVGLLGAVLQAIAIAQAGKRNNELIRLRDGLEYLYGEITRIKSSKYVILLGDNRIPRSVCVQVDGDGYFEVDHQKYIYVKGTSAVYKENSPLPLAVSGLSA